MVASRADTSNPARIPALGIRLAALLILSIVLMVLDHRQNHLQAVRQAIGAAVYPLQLAVDAPFRLWEWVREGTSERNQLQLELSRLQAERLLTNARLQRMTALEAENAQLRHDAADARILFHQVDLMTPVSDVQSGLHSGNTSADHHDCACACFRHNYSVIKKDLIPDKSISFSEIHSIFSSIPMHKPSNCGYKMGAKGSPLFDWAFIRICTPSN